MKKACLCLSLMLLLLCLQAAYSETAVLYDFEDGVNPGFFQSGSCVIYVSKDMAHSGEKSLCVSGRTVNDWDAADFPHILLDIAAGSTVRVSFYALCTGEESGEMGIGYAGGDYKQLMSEKVQPNTWTLIEGEFVMDETPQNLRFKTDNTLVGRDYYIDDVSITVTGGGTDAPTYEYKSDFSTGADGWYGRGAIVTPENGELKVTGRTSSWNSPGRNFKLEAGVAYSVSVYVKQDALDSMGFILSAGTVKNSSTSYQNITTIDALKGIWTKLSATFVPGEHDDIILFVESDGNGPFGFSIKDFVINDKPVTYTVGDIPSLKEVYADAFDFGCALGYQEAINKTRMEFYASQFNIMTHGNELKPENVFDQMTSRQLAKKDETAVAVKFDSALPLLRYAQENGIKVHGHVLLWHNQTPATFFRKGYEITAELCDRETMLGRMENYIKGVMEYMEREFPGLIVSWDVVNEAVDDKTGKLRDCNWLKTVGDDYLLRAFEYARKYAQEGTLLFYNDYSTPYEPKLTGICKLLDDLMVEGNIDGYGFQAHYAIGTPSAQMVDQAMKKIADKGLLLRVSEMDIKMEGNSEESLQKQADKYRSMMNVFMKYKDSIIAVHTWGVTDDLSWLKSYNPLLFDGNSQPKPAFWALVE